MEASNPGFEAALLHRVDRLDNMVSALEGNEGFTLRRGVSKGGLPTGGRSRSCRMRELSEKRCVAVAYVVAEVEQKGSLIKRVSHLENQLHKLLHTYKSGISATHGVEEVTNFSLQELLHAHKCGRSA
eukprot:c46186_g1_i1 orf=1-381(-)